MHFEWDNNFKLNLNDLPTNTSYAKDPNQTHEDYQVELLLFDQ